MGCDGVMCVVVGRLEAVGRARLEADRGVWMGVEGGIGRGGDWEWNGEWRMGEGGTSSTMD